MHWTIHLEGGPQRVNHAAVAVGDRIYSFGGYSSTEGYEITGNIDIWVLNTGTLRWSSLCYKNTGIAVPFKRYGHTVVLHGRKIYLWGGRNDFTASGIIHCFDIDTRTWSIPPAFGRPPPAADGHSACVIDGFMYIFGGFEDDAERFGRSVYRLNLHTFEWEAVETFGIPPVSRDFHTASAIGHRMYIFGGRCTNAEEITNQPISEFYCNQIMFLNTKSMKWEKPDTLGMVPCGRRSHSAVVYNNELYIIGGFNGDTQNHLKDVYKFNPLLNKWSFVQCRGKGPCPRRRHCSCVVGKQIYLFGGSSPRVEVNEKISDDDGYQKLIDHSDLHVLDIFPSLKKLSQLKVIEKELSVKLLPKHLAQELNMMTSNNIITANDHFPRKDYGIFAFSA